MLRPFMDIDKKHWNTDYQEYISNKIISIPDAGIDIELSEIHPYLFEWQKHIVKYALKKGKSAIFTMTGTGKTLMQLEFAKHIHEYTGKPILILAPLAVSHQTQREGSKIDLKVNLCKSQDDIINGVNITNYEKLHNFEPSAFPCIILDESSILKSKAGHYRNNIIESFKNTPFKLACTATPAPNDFMELGSHSEFMGVMSYSEMLASFFIHDGKDTAKWRLKGHGRSEFWKWLSEWSVVLTKPSDLGYDDGGFKLPPLNINNIVINSEKPLPGCLFAMPAQTLLERRRARQSTIEQRVKRCADIVNNTKEPFLVWCDLNRESELLAKAIPDAKDIRGSHSDDYKEKTMLDFIDGSLRVMISKPSISGHGLNLQHCCKMAFVGLSDSFEQYFQAVRRCWRFGQKKPVDVYVITSELEGAVVENIARKEERAMKMIEELVKHTKDIMSENIKATNRLQTSYKPSETIIIPEWLHECFEPASQ